MQKHEGYSLILQALHAERESAIQSGNVFEKYRLMSRIEQVRRLRDHHYIKGKGL